MKEEDLPVLEFYKHIDLNYVAKLSPTAGYWKKANNLLKDMKKKKVKDLSFSQAVWLGKIEDQCRSGVYEGGIKNHRALQKERIARKIRHSNYR